jgi:hypothetical protein
MPTTKHYVKHSAQLAALKALADAPVPASKILHVKGVYSRRPFNSLVKAGYAMFDHMAPVPYYVVTPRGREELTRIQSLPRVPLYAGGTEAYRKRRPKAPTLREGKPLLALPAPTPAACAAVEVMATLRVPITMLLDGRRVDAQAIADAVCERLAVEKCHRFLVDCTITKVLGDAGNVLVEGLHA